MLIDAWLLDILACPKCHSPLRADEVPGSLLAGAGILHLDRVSATGADLARRRAALGRPVTLDLHDAPLRPEARERLSRLWSCLAGVQLSEGAARSLAAIVAFAASDSLRASPALSEAPSLRAA